MVPFLKYVFIKDKNFYRSVALLAVPIAVQSMITVGVNMMDTIMVGRLGETELSAVSLANTFINIYHILCMGLSMGASVLVARFNGMKDQVDMQKSVAIMYRLTVLIASLFCIITLAAPEAIMHIYSRETAIIERGVEYLRWSAVTYYLLGLSLTTTIILRAVGKQKVPLYTSFGAFFINVGANNIFIFGHLGMPRMGVAGAALGTLIARLFEFTMICGFLFFKDDVIGFRTGNLFMKTGDLLKEYIRISIPVLVSDGILALGNNSVAMIIGRIGGEFVAANAVTAVTQQMSSVLTQGFSQAGTMITGKTLGEGDRGKAQEQGYAFLGIGFLLGLLSAAVILVISTPVIRSYHLSEHTAGIARQLMDAIAIIVLFQSTNSIMTKGVLRGGGDTKVLMAADNVFLWIASLPLGILAAFVLRLPAFWIYFYLKIDQVLKSIWCVYRLRSGKWIKKIKGSQKDTWEIKERDERIHMV
ncbi:MAG: MATE family efflux transporter [Lachnospiraceae bacterium]|nr:MATE family efflux transporter [Lachnospiraceae bacterium]